MSNKQDYRVWSRFVSRKNDSELKLRIQDMPKDRLDDFLSLFSKYFTKEETMHRVSGIQQSEEAHTECMEMVREMITEFPSHLTICCLDEGTSVGEIIGASIMVLSSKDDPDEDMDIKTRTKELGKMFDIMGKLFSMYDVMKEYSLDKLYDGRGVVVHPDYRGRGIAQNLFNTRRMICKDQNVSMTGAWVTTIGSQKAVERDGWETAFEISYEDFGNKYSLEFENVPLTCKYAIAKI